MLMSQPLNTNALGVKGSAVLRAGVLPRYTVLVIAAVAPSPPSCTCSFTNDKTSLVQTRCKRIRDTTFPTFVPQHIPLERLKLVDPAAAPTCLRLELVS